MSRGQKLGILLATAWPVIYTLLFMTLVMMSSMEMILDMTSNNPGRAVPSIFGSFGTLGTFYLLSTLWTFVMLVYYLVHVFRSGRVRPDLKPLWTVALVLGNVPAMLVYYFCYIWKDPVQPA